jgi:hypothetical protein
LDIARAGVETTSGMIFGILSATLNQPPLELSGARTPARGGTSAVDLAAEAFKMYKSSPSHGEGDIPPKFRKAGAIFHHSYSRICGP